MLIFLSEVSTSKHDGRYSWSIWEFSLVLKKETIFKVTFSTGVDRPEISLTAGPRKREAKLKLLLMTFVTLSYICRWKEKLVDRPLALGSILVCFENTIPYHWFCKSQPP